MCVCVRVCVYVCHCGAPPPSTTKTRCCGDLGQFATTSTINQDPSPWRFWIMSSPGSRFLVLLNTVCIQAIPKLWGFWIMSRPFSCMLVFLDTTTLQPKTPTGSLLACRVRRWVGLLARTLRGFPNQSQIKSPAIGPPASRERWQGRASRVRQKDCHSTPLSLEFLAVGNVTLPLPLRGDDMGILGEYCEKTRCRRR